MPEKCIIYSNPSGNVSAVRYKYGDKVLELSDTEKIKRFMNGHKHYGLWSLGLTPAGVFGAYFALLPKQKQNIHEMVIYDILTNKQVFSFHSENSQIKSISLKSGASLTYTVRTKQGETFSDTVLKNEKKGAGIRPINKKENNTSPYIISSTEIFVPKTGKIIKTLETILFPQEMHLESLKISLKEKAPERFDSISSFFERP